ncbi:MAG: polyketide synthase [Pelagibacteraceae bacterium TMED65]|nr:MAG: polyketide synthase [Pelagibacteraceae bacterium TMED65]
MDLRLKDKKVIITGGSRGIGLSIANSFLNENAKVWICARGSDDLRIAYEKLTNKFDENRVFASISDCTDRRSLEQLEKSVKDKWNELDIVVANVGNGTSTRDAVPSEEEWEKSWKENFESALFTTRVFLPYLEKSNGCLLFISSIAGLESFGAPTAYSTSKTAIISFAKNISKKLGSKVRINVLAPGNIYFTGGSWERKFKENKNAVKEMLKANVPMKRFGLPEEVASAAVFLCSQRASFITGSLLVVDGGQTAAI